MKKHIVSYLVFVFCVTNIIHTPLLCNKPSHSSSFSIDVHIDEKKVQTALLSSVGLVASSAALVLIVKGAIAQSTSQPAELSSPKLHASTLFGYGVPLLAAGLLTIFHPQVIDYLNS